MTLFTKFTKNETVGLLPADRTATGDRVYGQDAVQRLAFISSAGH